MRVSGFRIGALCVLIGFGYLAVDAYRTFAYGPYVMKRGVIEMYDWSGNRRSWNLRELIGHDASRRWGRLVIRGRFRDGSTGYAAYADSLQGVQADFDLASTKFEGEVLSWQRQAAQLCLVYALPYRAGGEPSIRAASAGNFFVSYPIEHDGVRATMHCEMSPEPRVLSHRLE